MLLSMNNGYGTGWWEILILSISGIFFLFSAQGVLFARSNRKFNKKIWPLDLKFGAIKYK